MCNAICLRNLTNILETRAYFGNILFVCSLNWWTTSISGGRCVKILQWSSLLSPFINFYRHLQWSGLLLFSSFYQSMQRSCLLSSSYTGICSDLVFYHPSSNIFCHQSYIHHFHDHLIKRHLDPVVCNRLVLLDLCYIGLVGLQRLWFSQCLDIVVGFRCIS